MRFGRSLRARLALAAGAAILAAVVLFAVVTVLLVDHQLRGSLDTALRQRALQVAQLAISAPAVLTDPGALEGPSSGRQIAVQVLDRRGRLVARSLALGAALLPQDALERAARLRGRAGVGVRAASPDGRFGCTRRRSPRPARRPPAGWCSSPPTRATSPTRPVISG